MLLKKNTAVGITVTCDSVQASLATAPNNYSVSKAGAGLVGPAGSMTTEQPGTLSGLWLAHISLAVGDVDTAGDLEISVVDVSGNVVGKKSCQVVSWDPQDAAGLGLSFLDAQVSTRGTSNYAGGAVASVTGNVGGSVGAIPPADLSAGAVAAITHVVYDLAGGVETGITMRQTMRVILSALAGKLGISGPTFVFRDHNDTLNRITAFCDNTGQRLVITLDLS